MGQGSAYGLYLGCGTFSEVEVERLGMSTVCMVLSPEWLDVLCIEDSGGSPGSATDHPLILDRPHPTVLGLVLWT